MKALDTDIYSELLANAEEYVRRVEGLPEEDLCITVVTAEEILRGFLAEVRRAEAAQARRPLWAAYELLAGALRALGKWTILPYSPDADALFRTWRAERVPGKPHDLRIAAICVACGASLITRNRRDFERVPGLDGEYWG